MSKSDDIKIRVLGNTGQELNSNFFNQELKKSDLNDPNLIEIFNTYNTNGDDKLDKDELENLFSDIQKTSQNIDTSKNLKSLKREDIKDSDCYRIFDKIDKSDGNEDEVLKGSQIQEFYANVQDKNKTLEPMEINKLLKSKKLDKKVKVGDVLTFLDKLSVKSHVKNLNGFKVNKNAKKEFESIGEQNVADVLIEYEKENGESIIQHIANRNWATGRKRNNYINIIKDKLIAQAQLNGIDTEDFETKFNKILEDMDITIFSKSDTSELDKLVNGLLKTIKSKQKLYQSNRSCITEMMTNPKICWSDGDRYKLTNKIIKYSNQNDPKEMLTKILNSTKDPKVKKSTTMLLNSKILDYFPIFTASITSKETQFRESDSDIFSKNGQGVMQLTKTRILDIYANPSFYEDSFTKPLFDKYKTADELYDAILDPQNVDLNMYVGTGTLTGIMNTVLKKIKNDSIEENINLNSPETFMQYVAMLYNANEKDKEPDPRFGNKPSYIKNIYGRDVILRFKRYTPSDIKINRFFEYNPIKECYITH